MNTHQLVQQWDQLVLNDGILYCNFESSDGTKHNLQMIIPTQLQEKVLEKYMGWIEWSLGGSQNITQS